MPFPLFVKPIDKGGGLGIDEGSVVNSLRQLQDKVAQIAKDFGSDSLVEQYLNGREFSVAVIKKSDNFSYLALPIELIAPNDVNGARILSETVKNNDAEEATEVIDANLRTKINNLALGAFEALGASDYGRIDIRLDSKGVPMFLEANLLPSLIADYGSFPKSCVANIGLGYEDMILRIVDLALAKKDNFDDGIKQYGSESKAFVAT